MFTISSAVFLFGLFFFLIFSSGEKQPWAQSDEEDSLAESEGFPLLARADEDEVEMSDMVTSDSDKLINQSH